MTWCCGHSACLFHPREEEEDKMLEAMIRKKGEARPVCGLEMEVEQAPSRRDEWL